MPRHGDGDGDGDRGKDGRRGEGGKGGRRGEGGKGRNGGRSGRGGDRDVVVSKAISWILRHGAQKEGLGLDGKGYADVGELLSWHKLRALHVTFDELQTIVSTNDKQRFSLIPRPTSPNPEIPNTTSSIPKTSTNPSDYLIRANQGHSLPIDSSALLTPMLIGDEDFRPFVVHGTDTKAWKSILKTGGLKRMGRVHVHFAAAVPSPSSHDQNQTLDTHAEHGKEELDVGANEKVISGMRAGATVLVWVDVRKSIEEGGLKWWRSSNGVLLTEGDETGMVGLRFVSRVVGRRGGEVMWQPKSEVDGEPDWKDGIVTGKVVGGGENGVVDKTGR